MRDSFRVLVVAHARPALVMLLLFSVLTGLAYPLGMTALAQVAMPATANGPSAQREGVVGQAFTEPRYFWSRPSAVNYDAKTSSGSNLGPTSKKLADDIRARVAALRAADPGNDAPVPADLVTSSASGLDPDISPEGALYQAPRVARARSLPEERVLELVTSQVQGRQFGFLGQPRVNVVRLNRALDALH